MEKETGNRQAKQEAIDITKYDYITKENLRGLPLITADRLSVQKELENWFGDSLPDLHIFATYNIITNIARKFLELFKSTQ